MIVYVISMTNQDPNTQLVRGLNLIDSFSLVVGCVVGTGVFIKAATMTQTVGSAPYVMLAWIFAGLLSLCGALVYAEIGSMYPQAGGEYVYLRESFGDFPAYLYGWTRVFITSPSSLAAFTVGGASFLSTIINLQPFGGIPGTAIVFLILFTILNCLKVTVGGKFQTGITILKVALIGGLSLLLFIFGHGDTSHFSQTSFHTGGWPGWSAFGIAMVSALWAYDGWNNMPMIAGEIKNPKRNVPLSLMLGMFSVLVLYSAINLAYFYVLSNPEILSSYSDQFPTAYPVATKAVTTAFGSNLSTLMSILFVVSALGALNGTMMSSARVPFAMASDGLLFAPLAKVNSKTRVPVTALLVQGILACFMAASGKFDQLTNYVVFSSWIFYAMVTASIFRVRRKRIASDDGYKVWGYPWMPIVFITLALLLLVNTVYANFKDTMIGLMLIAAGIPFYFLFKKQNTSRS